MLKITALGADLGACFGYRIQSPFGALADKYPSEFSVKVGHAVPPDLESSDLVVLQRQFDGRVFAAVQAARHHRGVRWVYDADDDFFSVPTWNPTHNLFSHPYVQGNLKAFLAEADAVFVSTQKLAEVYGEYNEHVYVLPNSLDLGKVPRRLRNNSKPSVGWAGSSTHSCDFKTIQRVLDVCRDRGIVVKVMNHDTYRGNVRVPWVSWDRYYEVLAALDLDASLLPLCDCPFNWGKSNIKFLESAAVGSPVVASPIGPYLEIEDGATGFVALDPASWLARIEWIVDPANVDTVASVTANAYQYVRVFYDLYKNCVLWKEALMSVMSRPPKRTVSDTVLCERVPMNQLMGAQSA